MSKKAFSLVELLIAMAIIAILLGLIAFGVLIVQRSTRDTQRKSVLKDIDIALNSLIVSNQTLPTSFSAVQISTIAIGGNAIPLPGSLSRQSSDSVASADTSNGVTDYCYGASANTFVLGVELEDGSFYYRTNTKATYSQTPAASFTASPTSGSGPNCTDSNL